MPTTLAELTTLRLGGPADLVREARSSAELVEILRDADSAGQPVLLLGGGSNLVVGDAGWPGLALRVASHGIRRAGTTWSVDAGVEWDALVAQTLAAGQSGLETMSGIPGRVGATPVQNVGAYGAEVADVLTSLTVYDRESRTVQTWDPARCRFGFRTSAFKHTDRYVVLDVTISLTESELSRPVRYLELARRLGIEAGECAPASQVRDTVLLLRRSKGMVLDPADHDSWSVGSFFVNPLLAKVPEAAVDCPRWAADGQIKLSAAWLIERAGFHRGFGLDRGRGRVSVSTKHTLALTNRGDATTAELLSLAAEIRAGVQAHFGITLGPEARLANCSF
ncbi:MAG: murB [Frankiales bacterium]|nr:murB [Frankiales bacterium]